MNLGQTSQHHRDSWKDSVLCPFCRTGSCRSPWILGWGFSAERPTWGEWSLSSSCRDTHSWPILSSGNARRTTEQALRSQKAAVCAVDSLWSVSRLWNGLLLHCFSVYHLGQDGKNSQVSWVIFTSPGKVVQYFGGHKKPKRWGGKLKAVYFVVSHPSRWSHHSCIPTVSGFLRNAGDGE